jgi:ABA responsive element binding factor
VVGVDRRLQRAVKNRLSAARSRERRLAYTAELEAQVAQLQAENEELRRQLAAAQAQR